MVVEVGVEEEVVVVEEEERAQEAAGQEAGVLPAGRVLLAAQALRNLLPHTVVEVVKRPPFHQVNSLQDVRLVEALDLKFMGTGSMEVVTQESREGAWPGADFHSYSGPWPGEALLVLGQRHTCTTPSTVDLITPADREA